MGIPAGGMMRVVAGLALAVAVVVVAQHDAAPQREVDVALLDVIRRLAHRGVAGDGDDSRHATLDAVGHVHDGGNGHAGIALERDLLDAIAVAAERALRPDREVPFRRHEIVDTHVGQDFAAKGIAAAQPFLFGLPARAAA